MQITQEEINKLAQKIGDWRYDPYRFVIEAMGFHPVGSDKEPRVSNQQYQFLNELRRLLWAKTWLQHSPRVKDVNRIKNKVLLRYIKAAGASVCSAKSTGKDCVAGGMLIPWALTCFDPVKVIALAPSKSQLQNILWREIDKWLNHTNEAGEYMCIIKDWFDKTAENMYFKDPFTDKRVPTRKAFTKTVSLEDGNLAKTIDGFHEKYMFFIIDEANKVEDQIIEQIENTCSDLHNYIFPIFNPTKNRGFAYSTHRGPKRSLYIPLTWDFYKTDRMPEAQKQIHIDKMKIQYGGEDTDGFKIYVRSKFPTAETGSFIPWVWVEEAAHREPFKMQEDYPLKAGVDIGLIKDKTIIQYFQGPNHVKQVEIRPEVHERDETLLAQEIVQSFIENNCHVASIEATGIGRAIVTMVRKLIRDMSIVIISEDVSAKPRDDMFYRRKDELWNVARSCFQAGNIKIIEDEELMVELTSPKKENRDVFKGKLKIDSNKAIEKEIGRSPDKASAFILAVSIDEKYYLGRQRYSRPRRRSSAMSHAGWMGK